MKATAKAHSNIAFVKYWGRRDEKLRLPTNGSVSMNLSNLYTITTVEFSADIQNDETIINNKTHDSMNERVLEHLNRIRLIAGVALKAKVVSQNNFPIGTGLSSSASGFAALTLAATAALGLQTSEKELSILARQGSGSACRSIPDGFVEWLDGQTSESSFSQSIFPPDQWDIADMVVIVSKERKDVATSEGQKRVQSSIFFQTRLDHMEEKIIRCKEYIKNRTFSQFGKLIEMEALELHAIMLTSWPSLIYWLPKSLYVMKAVQKWRGEGLEVYFTVNTGQDIHLIYQKKDEAEVAEKVKGLEGIIKTIQNSPSRGTYLIPDDLF